MIPHNKPTLGSEEDAAALRVLASGWLAQGQEVEQFEAALCAYLGLPDGHAVAVSSGTAALYLALWGLGGAGKVIGLPVYACAALRNAVTLVGGTQVYLDVGPQTPNVDIAEAGSHSIDILIAASMYGLPCGVDAQRRYRLIEDVAQAIGSTVNGTAVGLHGEVGIFSFYATKLCTTGGQGGAVVSRDRALVDAIRDYRQFDCRHDRQPRFNFQMTDLQAAIGKAQLQKLPDFLARRAALFEIYRGAGLDMLDGVTPGYAPVRYRAVMRTEQPARVIQALADAGIRAIVPLERWELLDDDDRYPLAAQLSETTVSLPLYPLLAYEDARRIAAIAREAA